MDILKPVFIFLSLTVLSLYSSVCPANSKSPSKASASKANLRAAVPPVHSGTQSPSVVPPARSVANAPLQAGDETPEPKKETAAEGAKVELKRESNEVKAIPKRGPVVSDANAMGSLFEDEKGFLAGLDYPELQVVPRASERLALEAQNEKASFLGHYWTVQVSSAALIVAALTSSGKYRQDSPTESEKSRNQFSTQLGAITGGFWLGATYYLDNNYSYTQTQAESKKITGKDRKSQLLKERLAEEALERPAKMAKLINNMAMITNFAMAVYINENSKQGVINYAGIAMGLAALPWLLENRLISNWEKHQEYKRKIYAPIAHLDLNFNPVTNRPVPLLGLQWRF